MHESGPRLQPTAAVVDSAILLIAILSPREEGCGPLENLPPDLYQAALDTGSGGIIASQIKSYAKGEDPFKEIVPHQMVFLSLDSMEDQSAGTMGFGGMVSVTGVLPNMPMPDEAMSPFGAGIPMSILPLAGKDSAIGNAFGKMRFALDEGRRCRKHGEHAQYFGDRMYGSRPGAEVRARRIRHRPALTPTTNCRPSRPEMLVLGLDASHKVRARPLRPFPRRSECR